jgi:hypothetical protein
MPKTGMVLSIPVTPLFPPLFEDMAIAGESVDASSAV